MLNALHIRQFAIIDDLALEFRPGFTVISGETGAGKSILVDALGLIFGQRADSTLVRHGAERAELNASFDLQRAPRAERWLHRQELDADGECMIRRTVKAEGGSRAYINGSPVTVQQLQQLAGYLIDLHGQHEQQRLLQPGARLALIDQAGVEPAVLTACRQAAQHIQQLQQELDTLSSQSNEQHEQRVELLRYQLQELESVAELLEQLPQLEQEHQNLSHVEELQLSAQSALTFLDNDEHGVSHLLQQALNNLQNIAGYTPELAEILQMLEEANVNLQEAGSSLSRYLDNLEQNPERLDSIDRQLSRIHDIARKHRVPAGELQTLLISLKSELDLLGQSDQRRTELKQMITDALSDYQNKAAQLSRQRTAVAEKLSDMAQSIVRRLGMTEARLQIVVSTQSDRPPATHGQDTVDIQFSANPGQPAKALAKVASGGELSRIGLALMVAAQNDDALPAMIFDEVDAGIGGATASAVGELLAQLSDGRQAFCVTHMAQVAAFADNHLQVTKQVTGDSTTTRHAYLENDQRLDELARMLSGNVTDSSRQHAVEMVQAARKRSG